MKIEINDKIIKEEREKLDMVDNLMSPMTIPDGVYLYETMAGLSPYYFYYTPDSDIEDCLAEVIRNIIKVVKFFGELK